MARGPQIHPSSSESSAETLSSASTVQRENHLSRRGFLKGASAALAVVGFDSTRRSWATEQSAPSQILVDDFPAFDGELLIDEASLAAAADDFGHAVSRLPLAVLRPGSVEDVKRLIRFARLHQIGVAARGQGHSTQGQAQVEAGVVIEMSALAQIHEVTGTGGEEGGTAWVDAGARWIDLIEATLPLGLRPATSTDYIGLSVGGTLSVGGVGSHSPTHGPQIDNVLELEVVTGRGKRRRCSPTLRRALFHAVRGGLGQFAVITKARIRLVPAASQVRFYRPVYDSLAVLMHDLQTLMDDGRFDALQAGAEPGEGGYTFYIEAAKDFEPGAEPDDADLLAGLGFVGDVAIQDMTQFEYLNRLQPVIEFLQQIGVWEFPHPWLDLFVPFAAAEGFIDSTLADLDPADVNGPILINPHRRSLFKAPFLRVPDGELMILFDLLRTAVPPTPERVTELVDANRDLYDQARGVGATSYRIGSQPFDAADWQQHFGAAWPAYHLAKLIWDPARILAPGQGIF